MSNLQKKILTLFSNLPDKDAFYLTGGTALSAFYLQHRKSHDLDFFTNIEELILSFSQKLELSLIKEGSKVERVRGFSSFVELIAEWLDETTVVHFALDSPFRFEQPFNSTEFPGLKVDSLIDIATNKLLALFGRAAEELKEFYRIWRKEIMKEITGK